MSSTAYYFHISVPLQCYCLELVYYLVKCLFHMIINIMIRSGWAFSIPVMNG